MVGTVQLAHASPGRMRLKVAQVKGNAQRARQIEEQIRSVPGIHSVEANPVTGSLVLTYEQAALESMELPFSVARVLGISLNDLNPDELRSLMSHYGNGSGRPAVSIAEGLEGAVQDMNASLRRAVGVDLAIAIPVLLAALGVRSLLVSEKTAVPAWHDFIWFAFSTYMMLNRTPAR